MYAIAVVSFSYKKNYNYVGETIVMLLFIFNPCRDYPDYHAYDIIDPFKIDWLNEVWDQLNISGLQQDDYRFVYMGPKGTWYVCHNYIEIIISIKN